MTAARPEDSTRALATYRDALRAWSRHASPRLILLFVLAAVALRSTLGSWHWWDLALMAVGAAVWPFLEWFLHKYVLHVRPRRWFGRTVDPEFARRHRAHHREPWRPELIVLPPYVHLSFGPVLLAAAWWLIPNSAMAFSALVGYGLAALNYEWTHFMVHTRIQPRNRYYQGLFRAHRMHHFRNENYWYGFTLTSVDRLLGTGPDPDATPRSPHCRDLGVDA
ncbi:MAG: sterol desaturase family protein [Algiphilus sp.]